MNKALVTGGAGFIGSHIALDLQARGWEVKVLDDFSCGIRANLHGFKQEVVTGDIHSINSLFSDWSPSVIFHFAAITDTTLSDWDRIKSVNVDGFQSALEYALRKGAKVVYASSAAIYGNGATPMVESQAPTPLNAYGRSKLEMEAVACEYSLRYKLPAVGLRYFNVYGPGERHKRHMASMIWQLTMQILKQEHPRIFKWGQQVRDHVYIKDVTAANLLAASTDVFGVYNVGTGVPVSFHRLINLLAQILNRECEPEYIDNPFQAEYQSATQADTELSKAVLKFESLYDVKTGIADYLRAFVFA